MTVLLPVTGRAAVPAPRSPREPSDGGEVVLVVEDEPALREVTRLDPGVSLIEKPFSEASLLAKLRNVAAPGG